MGKKQPKSGGLDRVTALPVISNGLQSELDPITNLPMDMSEPALNKQYNLPKGDWDMNTIINEQTVQDFIIIDMIAQQYFLEIYIRMKI